MNAKINGCDTYCCQKKDISDTKALCSPPVLKRFAADAAVFLSSAVFCFLFFQLSYSCAVHIIAGIISILLLFARSLTGSCPPGPRISCHSPVD